MFYLFQITETKLVA